MLGLDGNRDTLVIKDAFSQFRSAYPMPDRSADSTMVAIEHFKGERNIERFYSDRSGEIDRALRDLHIVPDNSQRGVPQNNVVGERLAQMSGKGRGPHCCVRVCHHASGSMPVGTTAQWKMHFLCKSQLRPTEIVPVLGRKLMKNRFRGSSFPLGPR